MKFEQRKQIIAIQTMTVNFADVIDFNCKKFQRHERKQNFICFFFRMPFPLVKWKSFWEVWIYPINSDLKSAGDF